MRILIVDDNEINRERLRLMLVANGHETVESGNGLEALEWLESDRFDAMISDILMPEMDGYRLCYEVRKSEKFRNLPIVLHSSTYTTLADEQVALKAGADRFIPKPAFAAVLLAVLKEVSESPSAERPAPTIEPEVLGQYSEKLVSKLKERSLELETAAVRLVEGNEELRRANEALERDVDERKRSEEQVKHLAFHDALTGLPNRLLFHDRLTVALTHARRHQTKLAILFMDLDRFKAINDSLGHAVGDELLRQVAERLKTCVRQEDTLARLGGDEFTLLVTGISSERDAAKIAQKILETIRVPFRLAERHLSVTTSIGVSLYPWDGQDADALLRGADAAMYGSKQQGRDLYRLCTSAISAEAVERLALENQLRHALRDGEFLLHYQPVVDLRSGRIPEIEALLRWQPEHGLRAAKEFIPVAENSDLIIPISQWVIQKACAQMAAWQSITDSRLTVAINLSARQFQQPDLAGDVSRALDEARLPAGCLDLEITESSAMQNVEHSAGMLRRLKDVGVHISLDDFGTGYSSLSYLKRFPIDRIKIDQSFVHKVTEGSDDSAIVAAAIAMAHRLNLLAVAEGVETEEQLAFLREEGCDQAQGFLFSRPLPPSDMEHLLTDRRELGLPPAPV